MDRVEIYNKMKELGMKHYIVSAYRMNEEGRKVLRWDFGFEKCHYTDESFDQEIRKLEENMFNFFDVIHLHEDSRIKEKNITLSMTNENDREKINTIISRGRLVNSTMFNGRPVLWRYELMGKDSQSNPVIIKALIGL